MRDNNDIIEPLEFTGYGLCRECNNPIMVKTSEFTVSTLDTEGHPMTSGTYTRYSFVCGYCGNKEPALFDPSTMRFYPSNPALEYLMKKKAEEANSFKRHYSDSDLVEK